MPDIQEGKLPAHVQQLLNERALAVAYGQDERVAKLDRALAAVGRRESTGDPGHPEPPGPGGDSRSRPPVGRRGSPREES
jgi:hypothetical protein